MPESALDYLRLNDLERYLFEDVRNRFHSEGSLGAFDFFCIVIWKANRAKSRMAARLIEEGHDSLEVACRTLTAEIARAEDERSRFMVLVHDWRFRLPMASAVLTVLYPDGFTVYDYRVCDVIGGFHHIADRSKPESVWSGYTEFMHSVQQEAPPHLSFRDKDRYLWARAFAEQLEHDIKKCFGITHDALS